MDAITALQAKLERSRGAFDADDWQMIREFTDSAERVGLAGCSLDRSSKSNWVEEGGGLPEYICRVARSIHKKRGMPISQAIPIAVGTVKRWARGGGDVDADTRAKAAAAVAQWEKLKAKSKGKKKKG